MKIKTISKSILFILIVLLISSMYFLNKSEIDDEDVIVYNMGDNSSSPFSLQMYNIIESKSIEYNIPKHILYNISYIETKYKGPFDWHYNPHQISSGGAQGPMQVITRYAQAHSDSTITSTELRTNLLINIDVSCSMLKKLYKIYGRWDLATGYYNTGYPQVNGYANYVSKHLNYKDKWIKP